MTCCNAVLYNSFMVLPTEHWAAQADYDLSVANLLYQQSAYRYCVFFCHLALEKRLKAILLERTGRREPPHSHNLRTLARGIRASLPQDYYMFLIHMTAHSIVARYPEPDDLALYNRGNATAILSRTRERCMNG